MSNGQVLLDDNNKPVTPLYDPTGHQVVNWQAGPVSTDTTTNQKYAPAAVDVTVTANNSSVGTDGSAIPTSSTLIGASDGTNLQQLLVESASNRNLRTGIYSGANEATVTGSNALKVDGSGVTQPVSGTITAVGAGNFAVVQATGSNLHVVVDSGTLTANQSVNIAQWAGAAPSVGNPVITQDQIRNWINNGQGFNATTGKITVTTSFGGLSLFNPNASGKTLIIFSLKYQIGGNAYNQVNYTTSDPALGTVVTPVNLRAASGTTSVVSGSLNVTGLTAVGTLVDMTANGSNVNVQALSGGQVYIIPANNGVVFYLNGTAATAYASFGWVEV